MKTVRYKYFIKRVKRIQLEQIYYINTALCAETDGKGRFSCVLAGCARVGNAIQNNKTVAKRKASNFLKMDIVRPPKKICFISNIFFRDPVYVSQPLASRLLFVFCGTLDFLHSRFELLFGFGFKALQFLCQLCGKLSFLFCQLCLFLGVILGA